jgi:YesN/AraC family two-component response regulator
MTILIADDFAPIRKSLRRMLEFRSNVTHIVEAADGTEAHDLLARMKPDVLILDIQMPGKTGLEILQDTTLDLSTTTVIVLTNHSDGGHQKQSRRYGADYFFDKTTECEKIIAVLEELV